MYVLERRRAVEVWNTLMGDPDILIARRESPNSLRALYGISNHQNGLMGSPDTNTAEIQIEALFASSPPFPTTDLPLEDSTERLGDVTSSVLEQMRQVAAAAADDDGYAPSSVTNPSTTGGGSSQGKLNLNGKPLFRARPVPLTNDKPDIVPRTTKAAALRMGLQFEKQQQTSGPRLPISKERSAQTFANVPGHKRNSTIAVASTAAPSIAPRMTKAASLRIGQSPVEAPARRRALTNEEKKATFEGVPGHKRRESIAVASVRAPTLAPRLNKSAALRVQKDLLGPPTSYMCESNSRDVSACDYSPYLSVKSPSMSRTVSEDSGSNISPPQAQTVRRPVSQASGMISSTPSRRTTISRSSSVLGTRSPSKTSRVKVNPPEPTSPPLNGNTSPNGTNGITNGNGNPLRPPSSASRLKPRPSSFAAPSITPRTNKSAILRAAKQEAEQQAAAKAAAKKAVGSRAPPSSFKVVVT